MSPSEPRSNGEPQSSAATPNEAIRLPIASPFVHNSIVFTVGAGAAVPQGAPVDSPAWDLVMLSAALPPSPKSRSKTIRGCASAGKGVVGDDHDRLFWYTHA